MVCTVAARRLGQPTRTINVRGGSRGVGERARSGARSDARAFIVHLIADAHSDDSPEQD